MYLRMGLVLLVMPLIISSSKQAYKKILLKKGNFRKPNASAPHNRNLMHQKIQVHVEQGMHDEPLCSMEKQTTYELRILGNDQN